MHRILTAATVLAFVASCGGAAAGDEKGTGDAEQAALERMVAELREEAAQIRGLPWKREVPAKTIARDDIPAAFTKALDASFPKAMRDRAARLLRRLGLLTAEQDPWELHVRSMKDLAAGFYDPQEGTLYVVEGVVGDAQRPILLHELIHALEDQHFGFLAWVLPILMDPDRLFAATCVVEGSAEIARMRYQQAHPDISALFMQAMNDPAYARRQLGVIQSVPAFLLVPTLLHYRVGPEFVTRSMGQGADLGTAVATLYDAPPISQEQVLHPERWFGEAKDYPRTVVWAGDLAAAAGPGWSVYHEGNMGELDLALYLDFFVGGTGGKLAPTNFLQRIPAAKAARDAAAGWDAGRILFLEKADRPLATVQAWAFDTVGDAREAADALLAALEKRHGEAWKPKTWSAAAPEPGAEFTFRTLSYEGLHGPGRLLHRGDHVIVVDGIPAEPFETFWSWVLRTRFTRDDRDTWGR